MCHFISGALIGTASGSSSRIFQAQFRPDSDSQFVTVGVNHVKFWSVAGNQLVCKKGVLPAPSQGTDGSIKMQTMLSLAFSAVSNYRKSRGKGTMIWTLKNLTLG